MLQSPDIDKAVAEPVLHHVGVEIDWRDGECQRVEALWFQGGEGRGEHAALAYAEQVDPGHSGAPGDFDDAALEVTQDIVVEREIAVGARWVAPVNHVEIKPEI